MRAPTSPWVVGVETNAPDRYRLNVVYGKISILGDQTKNGNQKKPYVGMFATNIPIDGLDKTDEIFCWGRRPSGARTYIRHLGCILLVPRYKLMCRKNL